MRTITFSLMCFIFFLADSSAQTTIKRADIKLIEQTYQACLDKGENMLDCSDKYYSQMDSCLNAAYKQLMAKVDANGKKVLKKEELTWIKKRDSKFLSIDKTNKMEGRDGEMIRESEKADFIKARVLALVDRL